MVFVVQGVRQYLFAEVCSVGGELLVGEGFIPAYELSGVGVAAALLTISVLNRFDLHVVPVSPEGAKYPAVVGHVAVPVGGPLPDANRRQMRGLEAGDVPLIDPVVGDSVESDLPIGPGLVGGPLDAVVEVLGFPRREVVYEPR